jgi:formylglycine-generating enzyme required for sulfatase activity
MELVTGKNGDTQTLRNLISPQKKVASFINEKQAADLVLQIAEALMFAHENHIIHRDLKPENILIDDRFDPLHAKVTDFGIAAWHTPERTELTSATASFGTWAYMPPEQHRSASKIDHRADIYSLGVMIYEMLTGRLPMGAFVLPSKSNSSLNPNWDKLITTMLQQDPRNRPQNMQEVIDRVKAIQTKKSKVTEFSLERLAEFAIRCVVSMPIFAYRNKAVASIFCVAVFVLAMIFWGSSQKDAADSSDDGVVVHVEDSPLPAPVPPEERVPSPPSPVKSERSSSSPVKVANIQSGRRASERMILTVKNVEYAFRWCPAGTFQMGSPESETSRDNDETQHRVTLSQGFWMQETEVTQEQWESVMGNNPSNFKGGRLPVEKVSWNDCQEYMRKLNALVSSDYEFSLPTEAQWEYACRAGSTTAYGFGDSREQLKDYAWFGAVFVEESLTASSGETTNRVGQKKANAWGLYDMHGNVWEWCSDWYVDYPVGSVTDPTGANSGSSRALRGGCWLGNAEFCRSAFRNYDLPSAGLNGLGVRCSLVDKSK